MAPPQLLSDYRLNENNEYFFNAVVRSIIRAFSVVDNNTEYFETGQLQIPFSNKVPVVFNVEIITTGRYIFNTNQQQSKTLNARTPGTHEIELILELGENIIQIANSTTGEESESVIYLDTKELYGWIVGAVSYWLHLNPLDGANILRNIHDISQAPLEVLENIYGKRICALKQDDQTLEEYRDILLFYYAALPLEDSYKALRVAPLGFENITTAHLGYHHFDFYDSWHQYEGFHPDLSTAVPLRTNVNNITTRPNAIGGELPPGVYNYVIHAQKRFTPGDEFIIQIEADVRHWMIPSTVVLEWEDISGEYIYHIYKFDEDGYYLLGETLTNKFFDQGQDFKSRTITFTTDEVRQRQQNTEPLNARLGYNFMVRDLNYVTDADVLIYLTVFNPPSDYELTVLQCMYDKLVPTHLRYHLNFIQAQT